MSSTVVPCLRYRDAPAIMEWLCKNFGFEKRLVIPGKNAEISHAELTLGDGMIMLGSHADDSYGQLLTTPETPAACRRRPSGSMSTTRMTCIRAWSRVARRSS